MLQSNVNLNDTAAIVCPECNTSRMITVAQFKSNKHTLKLRCACGHSFTVQLNFRRYFRKPVDLTGTCAPVNQPRYTTPIKIKNISLFGIGFELAGAMAVKKDDELLLDFKLDDKRETPLRKKALVMQVKDRYVGCSFLMLPGELDKDLGFYLRFK